jgi:hypothetical protein
MSGEQMHMLGYDVTDEVDGNAENGNFHGEFIGLKDVLHYLPITQRAWLRSGRDPWIL